MPDWFEKTPIGELMDMAARRFETKEALCYEGNRWTFGQLKDEVDRVASGLIQLGIHPGEKVALWMPNRPEWIHSLFAVAKIGAVLVPINTRFRTNDLEYVVRQSDSETLITVDRSGPVDYLGMVRELCPEVETGDPNRLCPEAFPELRRIVVLGDTNYRGTVRWEEILSSSGATSTTISPLGGPVSL